MIPTNDMRPGMTLDLDGELWSVLEYQHHKPGKGHAMVRAKVRSLKSGVVVDKTFRPDEKVDIARLDRREMQYLYADDTGLVFMDTETYDQVTLAKEMVGDEMLYLKEENKIVVTFYQDNPLSVELPASVELTVVETEPALKGATAAAQYKPATLDTGLKIQVPPFIGIGEKILVDTREGKYLSRVK
jgi:elongation factor P